MMCTAHHWSLFLSGFHLGEEKVGEKSIALPNKKNGVTLLPLHRSHSSTMATFLCPQGGWREEVHL